MHFSLYQEFRIDAGSVDLVSGPFQLMYSYHIPRHEDNERHRSALCPSWEAENEPCQKPANVIDILTVDPSKQTA